MNLDDLTSSQIDDDLDNFSPEEEALSILFEKASAEDSAISNDLLKEIYQISAIATETEREKISYSTHGRNVYDLVCRSILASCNDANEISKQEDGQ